MKTIENTNNMHIEAITENIFHVRLQKNEKNKTSTLLRYGILKHPDKKPNSTVENSNEQTIVKTDNAQLCFRNSDFSFTLSDSDKQVVLQGKIDQKPQNSGFGAKLDLTDNEHIYGLGDVARDRLNRNSYSTPIWVKNVVSYTPIPYMMSKNGWGILINTTWKHNIDIGKTNKNELCFNSDNGDLDFYLFAGDSLKSLLEQYTTILGRPTLLPLSAYGLTFVCNTRVDARELLEDGLKFREYSIPCDSLGLEPGWMSENYDFSTEKKWNQDKFAIPKANPDNNFLSALKRMGFNLSLWLCCDYDLSYEEERNVTVDTNEKGGRGVLPTEGKFNKDDTEQDEHFALSSRMDSITKPKEAWFEHLKKFVDQGVSAFKLDGANQVLEHPDRKWANGMDDKQMHNLYPLIYDKQMYEGYAKHTNKRPFVYSASGYTGLQQYVATWAGDTGGGKKPLVSLLNLGLSGHSNTSCDMQITSAQGIHFGFLQPWSQLSSWNYWRHPWYQGQELCNIFKFYAQLRYKLLPYIYSAAHVAYNTGLPIVRAMPLAFPDDPKCNELLSQYMLGDSLLVAAFTDKVYLPKGKWIDYWTGKVYQGEQEIIYTPPKERGGALFIKAGAIIPKWPLMQYVGEKSIEKITLDIFPENKSEFTLYEDDGVSLEYKKGKVATTKIDCKQDSNNITANINKRCGKYKGMPEKRSYLLRIHIEEPSSLQINDKQIRDWHYDIEKQCVSVQVNEIATMKCLI